MSKEDNGDFNEEDAVNEGIEKHDEYVNNAETDDEGNLTEDEEEYYETKEQEKINRDKKK